MLPRIGRRWRFQFTLRTLLLITAGCAGLLSWLAVSIARDRQRSAALEQLSAAGADFATEWRGPAWLKAPMEWAGYTPFRATVGVRFRSAKLVTESALSALEQFPEMSRLWLTDIDAEGPAERFTDEHLKHIQSLRNLIFVWINSREITDEGLENLHGMSKLQRLDLDRTRVRGSGLSWLTCERELTRLSLDWTLLDDNGMEQVGRFTRLKQLRIGSNQVTDAGMSHLAKLSDLESLVLCADRVSEKGVESLYALHNLEALGMDLSPFSPAAIASLRKALPLVNSSAWDSPEPIDDNQAPESTFQAAPPITRSDADRRGTESSGANPFYQE